MIFIIFISIISIYIVLSFVEYPDKTPYIKPIALELLKKSQIFKNKNDKLLSKSEVIDLLQESGCKELYDIKSRIVKTEMQNVTNHYNHWFSATCLTKKDRALDLRITLREKELPDFRIYFNHSYCYGVMPEHIHCGTQTVTAVPSR
jgi:hypothetical protein